MATQTMVQENTLALTGIVQQWDRRLRLRQTLLWLPLSLLPGIAVGIVLAVISRVRPFLLPRQIALITLALVLLGAVVFALAVWLRRRSAITSAQRFDVQFDLDERVSTALELGTGVIHSNDELLERQLADARDKASAIRVRDHLPLALRKRDLALVFTMTAILILLLILPNPQADALSAASAQQTAIDNAADDMRELTQDIAADPSLGTQERQLLLEQLQTAINTLEQPNISPEEAFAAVSNVEASMRDSAENLNRQSSQNQAALQQAADALRQAGNQPGGSNQNTSPLGAMEQVQQDLSQISERAPDMNPAERAQASQALRDAMQALNETNPQAASSLEQAAQQLDQGSNPQQQIEQAQSQMQQQAQQARQQQQTAQNLNNASQQAQQSADQINQAQQSQQSQQNQPGEQQQEQDSQSEQASQQGEQSQGQNQQQSQQNQQGQQGQQGQQSQQGQQQSQDGSSQASQSGSQNSEQSQSASNQSGEGQQDSQQGSASQAQSLSAGNQSGDQQGTENSTMSQSAQNQSQPDNNADGLGEGEFEAVNVPRRIGNLPNNGTSIELEPDASNSPVREGDFSENPNGQVTVPYNQVFSDYAGAANRALDSDYVPLGLRDVVRDYFTSLEPRR